MGAAANCASTVCSSIPNWVPRLTPSGLLAGASGMVASLIDRLHRFGDGEGQEVRENKRSNPEPGEAGQKKGPQSRVPPVSCWLLPKRVPESIMGRVGRVLRPGIAGPGSEGVIRNKDLHPAGGSGRWASPLLEGCRC